jgi:hypothetical protein
MLRSIAASRGHPARNRGEHGSPKHALTVSLAESRRFYRLTKPGIVERAPLKPSLV